MRILFILENPFAVDVARNALASFAEPDSIYFVHNFKDAREYIEKQVVEKQSALDLVITQHEIWGEQALDFKRMLISSPKQIYSHFDFNLDKLPVVLLLPESENLAFYEKQGFSDFLHYSGEEELHKIIPTFRSEVKKWRRRVVDEMDNLGIRYNSGFVDYTYYFEKVMSYVDTKILSENFKLIPRKLNYYWLADNKRQIEKAIDEYIKLLKRTHRQNKLKEEKLYHKFFNENSFFLKRDNYTKSWYEQRLHYNAKNYHEPDYSLQPNTNYQTDLNILEVKLPNEGFVKKTTFHPNLYSRVFGHLGQINDYKEYLESEQYDDIIRAKYGWRPNKISFHLLMGRKQDKDDNLEVIEKRIRHFSQGHIYLMTYDELLEYQVKYLERVGLLEIQ